MTWTTDPPPDSSARRGVWSAVVLFFTANVLFGAGLFAHAFLYNFYLDELGLGESVMGLAAAALTGGGLAALLPAGLVADRFGASAVFLGASVLATAGLIAGAVVINPAPIYAAAFLAGAGAAAWRVSMGPLVMRFAPRPIRSRVFSWNVALLLASGAVWIAASGAIPAWLEGSLGLERLSALRAGLVLGAVGTLAGTLPLSLADRVSRSAAPPSFPGREPVSLPRLLRGLRIPGPLAVVVAFVAVWMIAGGLIIPFFNIYFQRVHDLAIDRVGLVLASVQAATAVVIFGGGLVAGRFGPRRVLIAWMLLFVPTLWGLAAVSSLQLAIALFFVQGLVPPATNPLIDQILLEAAPEARYGAVSSWRNGATELSGLVGASAGGLLLQFGSFGLLFAVAGGVALLGALSLIYSLQLLRVRAEDSGSS